MKTKEAVAFRILELCKQKDISINRLATISAVPPSTLKSIVYGVSKNPGIVTLKILCDGLDMTLEEFFAGAVFQQLDQEIE